MSAINPLLDQFHPTPASRSSGLKTPEFRRTFPAFLPNRLVDPDKQTFLKCTIPLTRPVNIRGKLIKTLLVKLFT